MENIKKILQEEYIKCMKSPIYFMVKYCYISHPDRGKLKFNLYEFQKEVSKIIENNDYTIILKSRQLGISTLSAGYSLWLMLFNTDKNILCIATKQDTAKNMVKKVRYMYENLPSWLKLGEPKEKSALTLSLSNNSQMKATSAASDAGRSEAVSLLLIDEGAFISNIDAIWGAAQQTLATGGKAIILSTPNGKGNWFHRTWVKAQERENGFIPIKLPWQVHPERDQEWRDEQDIILGDKKLAAQECDCSFLASGGAVFDPEYMQQHEKTIESPIEKRLIGDKLWIFRRPNYNKRYMVVADVARGDSLDNSAFHVIDIDANEQVAEFKDKVDTKEFGHILVNIATEYNNALLVIENASVGWNTLQVPIDLDYPNLYYSSKGGQEDMHKFIKNINDPSKKNLVPGFTMSTRTRPLVIGKLKENFKDGGLIIHSRRTLGESEVFIWKNGKAQAQSGFNDDLILCLGMGCYVRETAIKFKHYGNKVTKASLNNISVHRYEYSKSSERSSDKSKNISYNNRYNPYKQQTKYGVMDFSWVIK